MTYGIEGAQRAVVLSGPHFNTGTYTQAAQGVAPLQSTYRSQTRAAPTTSPPANFYISNPEVSRDGAGITYPGITMSEFEDLSRRVGVIESDVKTMLGTLGRIEERLSHVATKAWVLRATVVVVVTILIWLAKPFVLSHLSP